MSENYILIVDDHAGVRSLLSVFLTQEGFCVKEAPDGLTALQLVAQEKPKLILLDQKMPGLTGLETLKEIRNLSPQTIVVAMTAYTRDQEILAAVKEGHIEHYVYKPFDLEELRKVIRELLASRNVG